MNNSRILTIKNAKLSGYFKYMGRFSNLHLCTFNTYHGTGLFLYPIKKSENLRGIQDALITIYSLTTMQMNTIIIFLSFHCLFGAMNFVEWYNRKQYPTIHKNSIAMVAFKEKIFEYLQFRTSLFIHFCTF